jgi:hypothetical protein
MAKKIKKRTKKRINEPVFDKYRFWARSTFAQYAPCVGFIESVAADGQLGVGTCFHVGEGVFVTARHVIEGRRIQTIGFDDWHPLWTPDGADLAARKTPTHGVVSVVAGPHFHPNSKVDVACFKVNPFPEKYIALGGHLDGYLGRFELVLYRTLVLGYPPIPFADRPVLVASVGEVNALVDKYVGGHPHFIVSTVARGGFSGGPAMVAYNEDNEKGGTAALGLITESLGHGERDPELGYMAVLTVEPIYDCLKAHGLLPECQVIEGLGMEG